MRISRIIPADSNSQLRCGTKSGTATPKSVASQTVIAVAFFAMQARAFNLRFDKIFNENRLTSFFSCMPMVE